MADIDSQLLPAVLSHSTPPRQHLFNAVYIYCVADGLLSQCEGA